MKKFPRISSDPAIMGGEACVSGTRILVRVVLVRTSQIGDLDAVAAEFPNLTREDVVECLQFAAAMVKDESLDPIEA